MLYMLDTCICIDYLRGRNEHLHQKLRSYNPRQIKIPVVVLAELLHGAYHSKRVEDNLRETMDFIADFEVLPLGVAEADMYGQILASLERKGQVIGNNDILIAATALLRNAVLVTNNTREFSRINGLKLDDWTL